MSWSRTKGCVLTLAVMCGMLVSGCSDIYFDRRETIAPIAGDAMAANRVTHMVDPWPPASANRNIAFNGEVMQHAVERYRQGRVIPPVNATTSSASYARAQAAANNAVQATQNSGSSSSTPPSGWAGSSQASSQSQSQSQQSQSQQSQAWQPGETR